MSTLKPSSSFSKSNETSLVNGNSKDSSFNQQTVVLRKKSRCRENEARNESIRKSKTLPRGFSGISSTLKQSAKEFAHMRSSSSSGSSQNGFDGGCEIFGMYSDLLFIKEDYSNNIIAQNSEEATLITNGFRKGNSDPDLAGIPYQVGTLDRRLKMKIGRPRSLDLSNWSVESRTSSVYTSSSESRSISRNSSSASHKFNGSDLSEIKEHDVHLITSSPSGKDEIDTEKASNEILTGTLRSGKAKNRVSKDERRTVLMLMGGRGYVNWRSLFNSPMSSFQRGTEMPKHSRSNSITTANNFKLLNSTDGNIIIWEKKV